VHVFQKLISTNSSSRYYGGTIT